MTERRVLRRSTFNSKKKTKVLAHGWLQSGQDFIDEFKTGIYYSDHFLNRNVTASS